MRLSHRFTQAASNNSYHFKLSTLIKEGALADDLITNNIKKIEEGLKDCAYIIDRYTAEPKYDLNPKTNRQTLVDYKVTIYPTANFQSEQFRSNSHQKNIQEHRIDENGKAILKPMRDQYQGSDAYQRFSDDRDQYEQATAGQTKQISPEN